MTVEGVGLRIRLFGFSGQELLFRVEDPWFRVEDFRLKVGLGLSIFGVRFGGGSV